MISTFTNTTINLDRQTDISENSIYGFIILKKNQEYVIDIANLFANRYRASFIMSQTKKIFAKNRF